MTYLRFAFVLVIAGLWAALVWFQKAATKATKRANDADLGRHDARRAAKAATKSVKEIARHEEINDLSDDQLSSELRDLRAKAAAARKPN